MATKKLPFSGNHRFSSLDLAQRFLRQHAQPDLRIWGLNAFEPKEGYLLLPRLEWRRSGGTATLRLHLHSDVSLRDDARSESVSRFSGRH